MSAADRRKQKVNAWAIKKSKVVYSGSKTSESEQAAKNREAATKDTSQGRIEYSDDSSSDFDSGGVGQGGDEYGGLEFAEGGQVGMAEGDQVAPEMGVAPEDDGDMVLSANELMEGEPESGFIRKPASETTDAEGVTDDNPTLAPNEENPRGAAIIINKQAVDQAGEKNLVKQIQEAREYLRAKGGKSGDREQNTEEGMSEIITADGEILIQPEEADVIGRKRLLALNERGKKATKEVKEKVQPEEQSNGFIKANEGGSVENITQRPDFKEADYMGDRNFPAQLLASVTGVYNDSQKANLHARDYAKKYRPKDDDRSEDTLRHMLGGGYMSDSVFKLPGYLGYNMREFSAFMDDMIGKKSTDSAGEESRIDLNNNKYGRALRKMYPDEKIFKGKAIEIARKLSQGKKVPVIEGISPMLSLGTREATLRQEQRNTEYPKN